MKRTILIYLISIVLCLTIVVGCSSTPSTHASNQTQITEHTADGTFWVQMTAAAGWSARYFQSSVALPDGSIVLMGGADGNGTAMNDVWQSTDDGASWKQVNSSVGWPARVGFSSVVQPDRNIVIMGGGANSEDEKGDNSSEIFYNDVWRTMSTG